MISVSYGGKSPRISKDCFVAENATLVGDVILGEGCSVWFGAVIRAEKGKVTIGDHVNVQDNCVIHTDAGGFCTIGNRVSIGHGAIIHGAIVGEDSLIGMGSILLNDAKVGKNCLVAAGSLLPQNSEVPEGMLVMGSPAKAVRKLSEEERSRLLENARSYDELRVEYLAMK